MLIIWDSEDNVSDKSYDEYYYWNGYEESGRRLSLLKYIDEHDFLIKDRYLSFIHEIGEYQNGKISVIDRLQIESGFSFWWMTLFVEKSPWKQESILKVLKLFAIEEILRSEKYSGLRLVGTDDSVATVIENLCKKISITFIYEPIKLESNNLGSIVRTSYIGSITESFLTLGKYMISLLKQGKKQNLYWAHNENAVFFCSYFFHLDGRLLERGIFYTKFWESLHKLIPKMGLKANWLQIYYKHDKMPTPKDAQKALTSFNKRSANEGNHALLENYLNWKDLVVVLFRYLKLWFTYFSFRSIKNAFCTTGSDLDLWPVMKKDWRASITGKLAIHGLMNVQLFKNAMADVPIQKQGFYLLENQSWERAFNFAWSKNGHGRLIGVAHSTVRYWDLRYFSDKRSINAISKMGNRMPQPDLVALNGLMAIESFTQFGYPLSRTVECEAVRYLNLANIKPKEKFNLAVNSIKVLIMGEYMPAGTDKMLSMLEKANERISNVNSYTFKPHPNYLIDASKYPSLKLKVVTESLDSILTDYDLVISSNLTSAAVDAYLAGIPLVILLDKFELNYSPLRKQSGVRFIYSDEHLANELSCNVGEVYKSNINNSLFFLDAELPKWKMILKN